MPADACREGGSTGVGEIHVPANPEKIGRYEILERVGRGGMGVLYRGRDPILDREVAIKVMATEFSSDEDPDAKNRFFREARAAAKLQHRNIVTIFEFAEEDNVPFIAMEFLRGQTLAARMNQRPPLSLEQKIDVACQLCAGLQFAHEQNVVHRDVKPANIWIQTDGSVKLLDFGIAKMMTSTLTSQSGVIGSASYMAPEQIAGKPIDGRADIFSAGVVLYELLGGQKPFEAESPTAVIMKIMQDEPVPLETLVPDLPKPVIAVVSRALQKEPGNRYPTAGDFGADLHLIRNALQSGAETMLADVALAETLYEGPSDHRPPPARTLVQPSTTSRPPLSVQSMPPEAEKRTLPPMWMMAAAAVLVAMIAIGAVTFSDRSGSSAPEPSAKDAAAEAKPATAVATPDPQPALNKPAVEAVPVAAAPAVLRVTSDPAGANVILDGRDTRQITPAEIPLNGERPQRIRLTKTGFRTVEEGLTEAHLQGGATFKLAPAEVANITLAITGNYPFEVVEGKRVVSAMGESHEITVSRAAALRMRAPDYFLDQAIRVDNVSGRRVDLEAPDLGRVSIRSNLETCDVVIAGRNLGPPPIIGQAIAAGSYRIDVTCPDKTQSRRDSVTVSAGQDVVKIIR